MTDIKNYLQQVRRIVVKIGTSNLTNKQGLLDIASMANLVNQLAELKHQGWEVVLVTSGAVGAGMGKLGLAERPPQIRAKQALAAIGQALLMQEYEQLFAHYNINVAQVLLSADVINDHERFLNVRNTFDALFIYDVLPIVNENDTVAYQEIKVGDNDTLAALVAKMVGADLLVLLTDIDGFYDSDPRLNSDAQKINIVHDLTEDELWAAAGQAGSKNAVGGMRTKLAAARIACGCGIPMALVNGREPEILLKLLTGECSGTFFVPNGES